MAVRLAIRGRWVSRGISSGCISGGISRGIRSGGFSLMHDEDLNRNWDRCWQGLGQRWKRWEHVLKSGQSGHGELRDGRHLEFWKLDGRELWG